MNSVRRSALVPYSAERMYELVADIESYPEFLPWCGAAEAQPTSEDETRATIQIDFSGIRQRFTTQNRNEPGRAITMSLVSGPFKSLRGDWRFTPLAPDACKIEVAFDYEFANTLLKRLVGPVFNFIASSLMDAFIKRADHQYTKKDGDAPG